MAKPKAQVLRPDTSGATLHIGDNTLLDQLGVSPVPLPEKLAVPQEARQMQPARQGVQASKPPRGTKAATDPSAPEQSASKVSAKTKKMPSQSPQTHLHITEKYVSEIEQHSAKTGV